MQDKGRYDLLVIGAGIFGATLAYEASQRGLKVLLVEKNDFGSGTSSNSLKTIHGGLRYLQGFDIKSSLISSNERKAWLTMAPGLVRPLSCLLPTTKDLMKSKLLVGAGALFYNMLTSNRNAGMPELAKIPNAHLISLVELNERVPKLADNNVTGGACWYDAQATNTERLVMACLLAAKKQGAELLNYCSIERLEKQNSLYNARLVRSLDADKQAVDSNISAKLVVDCSGKGQFIEKEYLSELDVNKKHSPVYVKAVNLVLKQKISDHAFGIKAIDEAGMSRLLFIAPWCDSYTLLGTWYFDCDEADQHSLSSEDIGSCIAQANSAFEKPLFSIDDVIQVHLGHLPADKAQLSQKGPDAALIKHAELKDWGELDAENNGLYSLKGTKFTLARSAAEDTIASLEQKHYLKLKPSVSANTALWGCVEGDIEQLENIGLNNLQITFLVDYFSVDLPAIIELCRSDIKMLNPVPGAEYCCHVVLEYCVQYEFVQHLTDLLIRRVPIGNGEPPSEETTSYVVAFLAERLNWDQSQKDGEVKALNHYYMKRKIA